MVSACCLWSSDTETSLSDISLTVGDEKVEGGVDAGDDEVGEDTSLIVDTVLQTMVA
jgi:hypothetical protein